MPEAAGKSFLPYKGLIPYEESDAGFFFGRRADTRLIIANLFAYPLTLLFGVGGVGKSSVLRAGVAYKLRERDDVLTLVYAGWEKDPLADLKAALTKAAYAKAAATKRELADTPSLDSELGVCLEKWTASLGCRVMILLDQFEDYLQYFPPDHPFADEFANAVTRPNLPVSFLISIREDNFAKLDRFEGSIPGLFNNYLRLEHLNRKAAQEAIRQPIDLYNQVFKKQYEIEQELVEAVLKSVYAEHVPFSYAPVDVKDEERTNHFDTVFLQLVMTRLWKEENRQGSRKLRLITLKKLNGVDGIVRDHIDDVMAQLTGDEKECASLAFHYLVTPTGTKFAYSARELAKQEPNMSVAQITKLEQTLHKLSVGENRLLHQVTLKTELGQRQYEIYHASLGPALLDWRIRYLQEQKEIEYKMRLEEEKKRAERRLKQKWQTIFFILQALLLILAIISFFVYRAWKAEQEKAFLLLQQRNEAAEKDRVRQLLKQQDYAIRYTQAVLRGHTGPVVGATFSPNSELVVTASSDGNAIVWNVKTGEPVVTLSGHAAPLTDVAYSRDGKYVVTASEDLTARLWESSDWTKKPVEMRCHREALTKAAFSADSRYVATASVDGSSCIWEVGQNHAMFTLLGHTGPTNTIEFSPNGDRVVTASNDGTARVWDARTGQQLFVLHGHTEAVNSANFNVSGSRIVTASADKTARIWDANTGGLLVILRGHEGTVNNAEFKPDGELVVTSSSDGTARIWRVGTGKLITTLPHAEGVNSARFSHDEQRVVTASDDKIARVWNVRGQKQTPLAELEGHVDRVTVGIFSPDDSLIVTVSNDQTARVFDTTRFSRFRISGARVDPIDYAGPCPRLVQMRGSIEIAEGTGTIVYRFVRGDGVITQQREVEVDSTQSIKWVIENLRVASFNTPVSTAYYLELSEPNRIESPPMKLRLRCGAAPELSPSPSPQPTPTP